MNTRSRHLHNTPRQKAISVERLFAAAFKRPGFVYQRESLLGWRPVSVDPSPQDMDGGRAPSSEKPPFSEFSSDVKVHENRDAIIVEVTLPDINEESLYLEISEDLLIIRAEKADTGGVGTGDRHQGEKPLIHRYVQLPVAAKPGHVEARLEGNVIYVKIDKPMKGFRDNG